MKKLSANELRELWVKFFNSKGCIKYPSAPLIPIGDDSLLWINAGVTPLKKFFDGTVMPPNKRLVSIQKCIRTNDIENVGNTSRHHTFFEMLGNFSVGDYFKTEAITWGYELLTSKEWFGFDKNKLYITYYPDDKDTFNLWTKLGISKDHLIASYDNFWEIGAGPCGPCTEIYYDRGVKYDKRGPELIRDDINNDRYIEVWNIVFSAFNANPNLKREDYPELPKKNIDTGAGLERILSIFQDTPTNFETDLFMPIINHVEKIANVKYSGQAQFKIIADHIKTITMAIYDGANFSSDGRGYVLRRLLRRAARAGKKLGIKSLFLYELVSDAYNILCDYYGLDKAMLISITDKIKQEEEKFITTLELGEKKIKELIAKNKTISAKDAFILSDTYGFPYELTKEYGDDYGIKISDEEYQNYLNERVSNSRENIKSSTKMHTQNEEYLNFLDKSEFLYDEVKTKSKVIKIFPEGIILDKTPLYAEQGGQVSDKGSINGLEVEAIIKLPNGQHLHVIDPNKFKLGEIVEVKVNEPIRNLTRKNHSATHLLQAALQKKLSPNIHQQGSKIAPDYLRFDFNYDQKISEANILLLEKEVNNQINIKTPITTLVVPKDEASKLGAMQLFGEKYGDIVRVVKMGDYSLEFCGGTHCFNTHDINKFAITKLETIGSGIYRLEAITGDVNKLIKNYLVEYITELENITKNTKVKLNLPKITGSYLDIINYKDYLEQVKKEVRLEKTNQLNNLAATYKETLIKELGEIKNNQTVIKTELDLKIIKEAIDEIFNEKGLTLLVIINPKTNAYMIKSLNKEALNINDYFKANKLAMGGAKDNFAQGKIIDYANTIKYLNTLIK